MKVSLKSILSTAVLVCMTTLAAADVVDYKWNYAFNGADWRDQCISGQEQSPINIDRNEEIRIGYIRTIPIGLNYTQSLGMTIKLDKNESKGDHNSMTIDGFFPVAEFDFTTPGKKRTKEKWEPIDMVIRQPSEHTIFGLPMDVELQIKLKPRG